MTLCALRTATVPSRKSCVLHKQEGGRRTRVTVWCLFCTPRADIVPLSPPSRFFFQKNNLPRVFLCHFLGAATAKLRNYQELSPQE